jgi:molybdopterin-guanine dinucleotide biosynthesis protein A
MMPPNPSGVLAGIFVGGASIRMGGLAKGLLESPDGPRIVDRWRGLFEAARIPCVLVGRRAEYTGIPLETLDDAPTGIGPLGGVLALLLHARGRARLAITVGCDMPYVSAALVRRLVAAPDAVAVAPKVGGRWEPMLARYDVARAWPIADARARMAEGQGGRSMRGLLDALDAQQLALAPDEEKLLADWDEPADRPAR